MLNNDYLAIKKYIKTLCIDNLKDLCKNTGLSEYETKLIHEIYNDNTRIAISIKYHCCESKVYKDMRRAISKINDYMKRNKIKY